MITKSVGNWRVVVCMGLMGAVGLSTQSSLALARTLGGQTTPPPPSSTEAAALAAKMSAELAGLKAGASVEDMEAAMIFVIDQGSYELELIERALDIVEGAPGATPELKQAVANVRLALRKRKKGTGAIGSGGGDGFGSGFSFPVVGGPGGGSNYTAP